MKRYLLSIITGAILLLGTSSQAAGPPGSLGEGDGDNSNPHNLSSLSRNSKQALTETQICVFCHTPHSATPNSTLWGRQDPAIMGSFPIRAGLKIDDDPDIVNVTRYSASFSSSLDYPNGTSKLCLSCHDGVTAIGALSNGDTIDMDLFGGDLAVAVDLSTSHPISFTYTAAVVTYLNSFIPNSYQLPPDAGYLDASFRVQCTSCHQPHQDTKGTGGTYPFWRKGSGGVADYDPVCLECHKSGTPGIPGGTKEHLYNP